MTALEVTQWAEALVSFAIVGLLFVVIVGDELK